MEIEHLVYKNNVDGSGGSCSSESDFMKYLESMIQKFNHRFNKIIGFFGTETLEGERFETANFILTNELIDFVNNYHIDADPNGWCSL